MAGSVSTTFFRGRRIAERAWGYFRLYGPKRFAWAVAGKLRQRLGAGKANVVRGLINLPASLRYQRQFEKFLTHPKIDRRISRPANAIIGRPKVSVIGDLNLPQCKKYRVLQKLEALNGMGVESAYSHYDDLPRALNITQLSTFVIFYRTRLTANFRLLVDECRRLRIPFAYDIDDPVFSADIYSRNVNLSHLDMMERNNLIASASDFRDAMRLCSVGIVSTPRMQKELLSAGFSKVFIWRNAIDTETERAIEHARSRAERADSRRRGDPVTIVYASGSRAHEADFREIEAVLERILRDCPNVTLHIVGYLEIPETLAAFGARITSEPFTDYGGYILALAKCHISVVPLVIDDFNDCKSAIRYMEAAQVETASVVSAVGDFLHVITDGVDGFLARTPDEWYDKLSRLIVDPALRTKMAAAAKRNTTQSLTLDAIGTGLDSGLRSLIDGTQALD